MKNEPNNFESDLASEPATRAVAEYLDCVGETDFAESRWTTGHSQGPSEIEPEANSGGVESGSRGSDCSRAPCLIEHQAARFSSSASPAPISASDGAIEPMAEVAAAPSRLPDAAAPAASAPLDGGLPRAARQSTARSASRSTNATDADHQIALQLESLCRRFLQLTADGYSLNQAARACGKSPSWFSGETSPFRRYQREGLAGLLPQRSGTVTVGDLTAQLEALPWFIPAAQFFYLLTNRTNVSGSVPEAIRRVISLPNLPVGWTTLIKNRFLKKLNLTIVPVCPDALREIILAREKAGQSLVPERIHKCITQAVRQHIIEQYRRPHETGLNYLQCPGTMMISRAGGVEEFIRSGDTLESDDGSINFPVCIPWTTDNGGLITETPCSAKFGVIVGRFQWLRAIDAASRFRPGWVFVARSRGSYRGADVLTLLNGLTRQHGVWNEYRFERGVFKSALVKNAVGLMGARLHTVISPHSKPFVEGGFNQDWTKLSVHFPQCDIGRYRGDTEEANRLVQSCRAGHQDPRKYFPMLADAMQAFDEITREENRTLVKSRNSGQWVPEEKWQRETGSRALRRIESQFLFAFAPFAIEWTVKGMIVGGRVPIFEDMSVPFDFTAPWLHQFSGARVRVHFDATAHKCFGTAVLLQAWHGHRAGEVLGQLQQINETTGYIRTVLGWGDDIGTAGLKARQQSAVAMRREVRTMTPGGKSGYTKSEMKSLESITTIEKEATRDAADVSPSPAGAGDGRGEGARASRRAELEAFERNNQHLFV
ncbi:MAG: hypothetical protein KGL39_28360 [Patescibacteria group bacterium]|nr:hypothetical protein [Patescibacteria group bacterium]